MLVNNPFLVKNISKCQEITIIIKANNQEANKTNFTILNTKITTKTTNKIDKTYKN